MGKSGFQRISSHCATHTHTHAHTALKLGFVLKKNAYIAFKICVFNCQNFADKRGNSHKCRGKKTKEFKGCNSANEQFNLEEKCVGENEKGAQEEEMTEGG